MFFSILIYSQANDINIYLFLFLGMFLIHECEEFFGLRIWIRKFAKIFNQRHYKNFIVGKLYQVDAFAFKATIIEEVFIVTSLVIYSFISDDQRLFIALFIVYSLHILIHIIQTILAKTYLPLTVTSFLSAIYCIIFGIKILNSDLKEQISTNYILIAFFITYLNLFIMPRIFGLIKKQRHILGSKRFFVRKTK